MKSKYFVISYRWYGYGGSSGWGCVDLEVKDGKLNKAQMQDAVKKTNSDFDLVVPITITEMTEQQYKDWIA